MLALKVLHSVRRLGLVRGWFTVGGSSAVRANAALRGVLSVLAVAGGAMALAACSTARDNSPSLVLVECLADRADIVADIDWDRVQPYQMRIVDGEYRPMIMHLETDRPYILEIYNADRKPHDFWAPGLLKQGVALDSIQFGEKAPAKGCVNGVRIKPRDTVTLRFVPVWEGRYEVRNIDFAMIPTIGAHAVVNVVPPRVGGPAN